MIKEAIHKAVSGKNLSEQEMIAVMTQIMDGQATDAQIASFITALRMKGETAEEITGAARVMLQKAVSVPVAESLELVDIVGTGGDGTNTFNISTAAAFVACGAGLRVAKHGNRSVSSSCGSADGMGALGVKIDITPENVARCIEDGGIGFLFAPNFHRAMKYAASARRETGIRSIFNIVGPLTNPARAGIQLLGVYESRLLETAARVMKNLGRKRALVVHGSGGLDEISLSGTTSVSELQDGAVRQYVLRASDYGLQVAGIETLRGGTARENADIITCVLSGETGPRRDVVLLNAGAAVMAGGLAADIAGGMLKAAESIDSGQAMQKLELLKSMTGKMC